MRASFLIKLLFIFLGSFLLWACDPNDGTPEPEEEGNPSDRELMLGHYADHIIIPAYKNFKVKMDSLVNKTADFKANPTTASLTDLRTAWLEAYIEWQKIELFDVGPANNISLRSYFNIYPTNEASINSNIASGTANLEVPVSYSQQGFPALDYLINGLAATDTDILAFYTTASDAAQRLTYLEKVVTQMNSKFNQVNSEWVGGYRNTFVSKTGIDMSSSTSLLVNGYVLNYERYIRSGKIGIPAGVMTTTTYPEKVESFYYKDLSLILAKTAHQASIDFFNGKSVKTGVEGPSFKTYLDGLGAKDNSTNTLLSSLINSQFTTAHSKLDLLDNNLHGQIQTNNQEMIDAFNEMQKVVGLLKVDMTSAMSITITYTDNDGD